jgi:hypothetical protein
MNDRWRDDEHRGEWRPERRPDRSGPPRYENRPHGDRHASGYGESSYDGPREDDRYGRPHEPDQRDIRQGYGGGQSEQQSWDRSYRPPPQERGEYGRYGQGHGPGGYGQGPEPRRPREYYAEGGFEDHQGYRADQRHDHGRQDVPGHSYHYEDRSWWDRTRDEFGAWMGDHEAEQRRRMDHLRERHPYEARRDDTGWSDRFSDERQHRDERDNLGRGDFRGPDRRW